MQWCN